jgi:hypothetical protein
MDQSLQSIRYVLFSHQRFTHQNSISTSSLNAIKIITAE